MESHDEFSDVKDNAQPRGLLKNNDRARSARSLGSFSNDDGDGKKNVT